MLRPALPIILAALLPLTSVEAAAPEIERRVDLSSFQKLRVEGPFLVTLTTGPSPRGMLSGETEALRGVETRLSDGTLVVRRIAGDGASSRGGGPVTLTLIAPPVSAITVIGGAQVTAEAMRGGALTLSITGAGEIRVDRAEGDQLNATLLGPAKLTIGGGRVAKARLLANGPVALAANGLEAGDLFVTLEGPGEIGARARYTATVTNAGLGHVTVEGTAKCRIMGGGPVRCGAP